MASDNDFAKAAELIGAGLALAPQLVAGFQALRATLADDHPAAQHVDAILASVSETQKAMADRFPSNNGTPPYGPF